MGGKKTLLFCCFERDEVFFSRARARPSTSPLLSFFKGRTTEKAKFSSLCLLRRVEAFEKLTLSPLKKRKKNIQKKHPNSKLKKNNQMAQDPLRVPAVQQGVGVCQDREDPAGRRRRRGRGRLKEEVVERGEREWRRRRREESSLAAAKKQKNKRFLCLFFSSP